MCDDGGYEEVAESVPITYWKSGGRLRGCEFNDFTFDVQLELYRLTNHTVLSAQQGACCGMSFATSARLQSVGITYTSAPLTDGSAL